MAFFHVGPRPQAEVISQYIDFASTERKLSFGRARTGLNLGALGQLLRCCGGETFVLSRGECQSLGRLRNHFSIRARTFA